MRDVAHDLKTPITAVKGSSEGIMDAVALYAGDLDKSYPYHLQQSK